MNPPRTSPPLAGGDVGEGEQIPFVHPHLHPPPSKGEEIKWGGEFQISLVRIWHKLFYMGEWDVDV